MSLSLAFTIEGKIESKSNARGLHWASRHRSAKTQRSHAAYSTLKTFRVTLRQDPAIWFFDAGRELVTVRLTRFSPRRLDDDNLRDAFKSIRDGVADQFGVADNYKRLAWEYAQEKPHKDARGSHVRIEIFDGASSNENQ